MVYLQWAAASLLRIALGTVIAVGLIKELDPFPWYWISQWQARISERNIDFPASEVFFWFAHHWLELAVAIGLIQLNRLTASVKRAEKAATQ